MPKIYTVELLLADKIEGDDDGIHEMLCLALEPDMVAGNVYSIRNLTFVGLSDERVEPTDEEINKIAEAFKNMAPERKIN